MENIKQIIAQNIISLRKQNGLTQNEFAQKLNYSDNTISRWEHAEITPSIESLVQISKLFNVPLEYLIKENITQNVKTDTKAQKIKKLATILLCVSLVWFVAILTFFYSETFFDKNLWIIFVWAVPASCLVLLAFTLYVKSRAYGFTFCTIFIWTFIASFYLQFLKYNMFLLFLVGIPAQFALIIWTFVRPSKKQKDPNKMKLKAEKKQIKKIKKVRRKNKKGKQ